MCRVAGAGSPLTPHRPGHRPLLLALPLPGQDEVTIRRRPPHGVDKQPCGPVDFAVPGARRAGATAAACPPRACCAAARPPSLQAGIGWAPRTPADRQTLCPRPAVPEDNKPQNILEEIVWHKAVEVEGFKARQPLPLLMKAAAVSGWGERGWGDVHAHILEWGCGWVGCGVGRVCLGVGGWGRGAGVPWSVEQCQALVMRPSCCWRCR